MYGDKYTNSAIFYIFITNNCDKININTISLIEQTVDVVTKLVCD